MSIMSIMSIMIVMIIITTSIIYYSILCIIIVIMSAGTNGIIRRSTGTTGRKRFSTKAYRKLVLFLHTSPTISGDLREFTGECSLGILYSNSLLFHSPDMIR